ncbi:hypothetical protein BKI52_43330 [marine bacterium AO1-C]|nr:hypothetical protein BKI52_43330 [marine bacterium AO1-C]
MSYLLANYKATRFLLLLSILFINTFVQAQNFQWARQVGGTGQQRIQETVIDVDGNLYCIGVFQGTVDFDPGINTFNLTSKGGNDIFVTKLNNDGNFVWAYQLGSTGNDWGSSIALDANNHVLIAGLFNGTMDFDPSSNIANLSSGNMFIAKYDSDRNYLWAKGISARSSIKMDTDKDGNLYVIGSLQGTADLDPSTNVANVTASGINDIYVAKYNKDGLFQWVNNIGGNDWTLPKKITVDDDGNLYIVGEFMGTVDLDMGTGTSNRTSKGNLDAFIAKYNTNGVFQWGDVIGGSNIDSSVDVAVADDGQVYFVGDFRRIEADDNNNVNLTSIGGTDIFLVSYNKDGVPQWTKTIGGGRNENVNAVTVNQYGDVAIGGQLISGSSIAFDTGSGTHTIQATNTGWDVFMAKFDKQGVYKWAKNFSATASFNQPNDISFDNNDNLFLVGYFSESINFSPGNAVGQFTSIDNDDAFIVKHCQIPENPGTITGTSQVCPNQFGLVYSISPIKGATGYEWTLPNGVSIFSGHNTNSILTNFANAKSGKITVKGVNSCGESLVAAEFSITVTTPQISIAADKNNVCAGEAITFTATPTFGGTNPIYQWRINGQNVLLADQATFTHSNLKNGDKVSLQMVSSLGCFAATTVVSEETSVIINDQLTPSVAIISDKNNICIGETITFMANPTFGGTSPIYQWRINGVDVSSANQATFTRSNFQAGDKVSLRMISSLSCLTTPSVMSEDFTVNVNAQVTPSVTITPNKNSICTGESITFTANPTFGGTNPTYQWRINGQDVPSANRAVFTRSNLQNGDRVSLQMISSFGCASISSVISPTFTMIVNAKVTPFVAITADANNTCETNTITFTATSANGGTNPIYQWQINGVNIVGANGATFSKHLFKNQDKVRVILTSSATCVTTSTTISNEITMNIERAATPTIRISGPPVVCKDTPATFTTITTNVGVQPSYQWVLNDQNIAGATNATFTTSSLKDGDILRVIVKASGSCVQNDPISSVNYPVSVNELVTPSVSITASDTIITPLTTVVFTAKVENAGFIPTFQWKVNDVEVANNDFGTFTPLPSTLKNGDKVKLIVTTSEICVTNNQAISNEITITVTNNPTALPDQLKNARVIIYPNPSKDVVRIKIDGKTTKNVLVNIYDAQGTEVKTSKGVFANNIYQLDISALPRGKYFLKMLIGDELIVKEVMRE